MKKNNKKNLTFNITHILEALCASRKPRFQAITSFKQGEIKLDRTIFQYNNVSFGLHFYFFPNSEVKNFLGLGSIPKLKKLCPKKTTINNPKSKCLLSKRRRREEIFNDWNLFIFNFLAIISSGLHNWLKIYLSNYKSHFCLKSKVYKV